MEFVDWHVFETLLFAGLVGVISAIPLNNSVLSSDPKACNESANSPNVWLLERVQQVGIYAAILSAALFCGFYVIERLGLAGAPLVEMWLAGNVEKTQFSALIAPALAGVAIGAMLSPITLYQSKDQRIDFTRSPFGSDFSRGCSTAESLKSSCFAGAFCHYLHGASL